MMHSLAQLDFTVIAIALGDPVTSLKRQGRLGRWIFGRRPDGQPLANPRLETLRRYVVMRRRCCDGSAEAGRTPLQAAGYSLSDINEIDRLIDNPAVSRR